MKKIAVLLLCLSMLSVVAVTVSAEEADDNIAPGEAVIGTEVPASHKVKVIVTGNAEVTLDGKPGTVFEVERLSEPVLTITANDGGKITKVTINGEDVTDKLIGGKIKLDPIYEDIDLVVNVETEIIPPDSSKPDSTSQPDSTVPESSEPDSSLTESSAPESVPAAVSSTAESKAASSSASSTAKSAVSSAAKTVGNNANPSTGVVSGVSLGSGLLLAALVVTKHKSKDSDEE